MCISALSCQESREELQSGPDISKYRNVGTRIPSDMGARWIETYEKSKSSGRSDGNYSIGSAELQAVRASIANFVGMAFQYGLDENGTKHIIVIPIDETLRLWTSVGNRIYWDANTNTVVSKDVAFGWAKRYQSENPDAIWFHYFGANIFDEIFSFSGFSILNIVPALDDLDLSPELLLVVGDTANILLGRSASETPVYDASYPCPRCEVQ